MQRSSIVLAMASVAAGLVAAAGCGEKTAVWPEEAAQYATEM